MGFFNKKTHAAVLIDISSSSVGGAYIYTTEGEKPVLCYTVRFPVEMNGSESNTESMVRTLEQLSTLLIQEGAPALKRQSGLTTVDLVLASVAAPWQETTVRTVVIEEKFPFTFTRKVMEKAVKTDAPSKERVVSDTSIVATRLNGYETEKPLGKRATRAELTVLTSTIDRFAGKAIMQTLRKVFHSHHIEFTAFAPVAFAVISDLYPAQKDFIVIDVSGTATDAIIVKKGVLAGVRSVSRGIQDLLDSGREAAKNLNDGSIIDSTRNKTFAEREQLVAETWLTDLEQMLSEFAKEHPLPRTVFLLADESVRGYLKRMIDTSRMRALWLTDEPLATIALAPEHLAHQVRARGFADGDTFLSMLGLFYEERTPHSKK